MPETRTKPEKISGSIGVLPAIGDLLQESFALLQKTIFSLFLVTLVEWVTLFVFFTLGVSLFVGAAVLLGIQGGEALGSMHPFTFGGFVLTALGFWVVFTFLSLMFQILAIQIVSQAEKQSIRSLFGKSIRSLWPFFLMSLLMGFLILGGGFLFFLPGVLFALLFVFASFEVVVENQGPLKALQRSMGMVIENFAPVTLRLLVLFALMVLVNMLPHVVFSLPMVSGSESHLSIGFSTFLTIAVSLFAGWYSLCYVVTLYQHTKAASTVPKSPKLLWPLLIAITGWILAFIATIILTVWFMTVMQSGLIEEFVNTAQKQKTTIHYEKINAAPKTPPLSLPPAYEL